MAFSIVELITVCLVIIVPTVLGIILVIAAVLQKTGTSDVLSWSSTESGNSDPYHELQDEDETLSETGEDEDDDGDEESLYSDYEQRKSEAGTQENRSERDPEEEPSSDYESQFKSERPATQTSRASEGMSEYTYY